MRPSKKRRIERKRAERGAKLTVGVDFGLPEPDAVFAVQRADGRWEFVLPEQEKLDEQ